MVGVADPDNDRFDLLERFFLGRRRHPANRLHALGERRLDVLHHVLDLQPWPRPGSICRHRLATASWSALLVAFSAS